MVDIVPKNPTKHVGPYAIDVKSNARMFDSPLLEYFSKCPGWLPLVFYVPVTIVLVYLMATDASVGIGTNLALVAGGVVFWTFAEYWLHREVFHWRRFARLHFSLHGVHHVYPNDRGRLVMPPVASAVVAIPMWFLCDAIFGYELALPFYLGFVIGYLWYDMTHYWTHHGKARSRWGKLIRRHHMLHHFKTPSKRFGVSTPFWDLVFRTWVPLDSKRTAEH